MSESRDLYEEARELGQLIKRTREHQGLSQGTLARMAEIGLQTLIRIEDGSVGSGQMNVQSVLRSLRLPYSLIPAAMSLPSTEACHGVHLHDSRVQNALDEAVELASERLQQLMASFGSTLPEANGISSNFDRQLRRHLSAMLCGRPSDLPNYPVHLKKLVYSSTDLGGPCELPAGHTGGWLLRVKGTKHVLQDGHVLSLEDPACQPLPSREALEDAYQAEVQLKGHLVGALEAYPVPLSGT